ncbi:hypothetical protein GH714_036860 [Hevea brasiliensis]|uniref:Arf-GAP domain-containing protein n=1 Tax=Hevea brasiliensis TaxID=3981 RepID=A0A6A6NF36_HEVBR|nr:hypothetical protein GH714_036860 [Hevea brasiliensis]
MSMRQENSDGTATCLQDLLFPDKHSWTSKDRHKFSGPQRKLEKLLSQSGNKICADCGSPDPKWVSLSHGVFICIKCSGVHRSLGVHISKVLSVKLDEWTDEQVNNFIDLGGNTAANRKYEACLPDEYRKPKPDASIEERSEFIRRKYEQLQFLNTNDHMICPCRPQRTSSSSQERKLFDKQATRQRIGNAFRNSWGRKDSECKNSKKSTSMAGMVEFIGLIKVNVVRGTNLAVRDVVTSDPYVILALGHQLVYDKDTFSTDDFMGEAEIDIQPLVAAAKAYETSTITEPMQLGKWVASKDNTLLKDGVITLVDGIVKQDISLRLQNVERGVLEIELECVPLTQ